ncbi:GNAT family N-acetyltransferase [Amycolatopsis minnesotensis]|uniref:GNAT family N-acetyltransferase n=1 Tax=Amycolatopsis minnesotensis TaxID=337894 RepID=A0ABP5BJ48_9PSEU
MDVDTIATAHNGRLRTIDPLLPDVDRHLAAPDGADLLVEAGGSAAAGFASRTEVAADSRDALSRPLVEHTLSVHLAGPEPGAALEGLLTRWEAALSAETAPGDWDTAAVVARPSRDSAGCAELLRHGFSAVRVLAARPADRLVATGPRATPGVHIRPAEQGDLATAVELQLELRNYEAQFGVVTHRPDAGKVVEAELGDLLSRDNPALWIAELYGRPLGMLHVQMPHETGWVAPYTSASRVGYLSSLHIAEAARSSGVGTALAAHAHQLFDEASTDVVLLHHALANPRSTPFWCAQGYRPLWTYWYRRPAVH